MPEVFLTEYWRVSTSVPDDATVAGPRQGEAPALGAGEAGEQIVDATGREGVVFWHVPAQAIASERDLRVVRFRAEREPFGLSTGEATILRTLAVATGAASNGVFPGSTEFRFRGGVHAHHSKAEDLQSELLEDGCAQVAAPLVAARSRERAQFHVDLLGITHTSNGFSVPYLQGAYSSLAARLGVSWVLSGKQEASFAPRGASRFCADVSTEAAVPVLPSTPPLDLRDRGALVEAKITLDCVRPRGDVPRRAIDAARRTLWEARRIDASVEEAVHTTESPGLSLTIDLRFENGAATFASVSGRDGYPDEFGTEVATRALRFVDGLETTDSVTLPPFLALAACSGRPVRLRVGRSTLVDQTVLLLNELRLPTDLQEDEGLLALTIRPAVSQASS